MNLHAIRPDWMRLLLDFFPAQYGWRWRYHPTDVGAFQYNSGTNDADYNWETLSARDSLRFVNEAERWDREGRRELR